MVDVSRADIEGALAGTETEPLLLVPQQRVERRRPRRASRFDLVTLDLDGTLLPDDTAFAVILRGAGRGNDVAASDARYHTGEQDLETTFWEQWDWVKALTLQEMHRHLRKAAWLPDIAAGVSALKKAGLRVTLLTDQPSIVTDFLGRWDLADAVCSPAMVRDGRAVDVDGRFDKWQNLAARLAEWTIDPARVCHVGNGMNDIPVWHQVGAGVAVFAEPEVAREATVDVGRPRGLPAVADVVVELHRGGK
jgi:phosphoserine phosphatase